MNKITTALLGLLLMILGSSCHSTQAVSESDYDLIAILSFDPTVDSTAQPKYLIKNLDGTPFDTLDMNAEYNFFNDGSPKLSGKIVFFFSDQGCYHFFCKKPEEGKPLQILIGDEWKTIEPTPQIKVDSTRHFFTKELVFFPIVDYGQELPIAFYPTPKEDPAKRITLYNPQNEACGTSQTKRTPTHPAEKKRSVTFSGNIPRAFGNHPNALLASVK